MFAESEMSGWPLALTICVCVICFASLILERWPWEKWTEAKEKDDDDDDDDGGEEEDNDQTPHLPNLRNLN